MNKATGLTRGKWIVFLGADDLLLPGFSEAALHLKNPETLYYGYCMINGKQSNRSLSAYEIAKVNVCHHAIFYPASVFKKYQYHTPYKVYADHALNIQCWGDSSYQKKYLPYPIARFGTEGFSSQANDVLFKKEKISWIKKYMSRYIYLRYLLRKWKETRKGKNDYY
jgi:hypothetical protein